MRLPNISPELGYVLLVLGLFLVPRVLQRFRLPGAITSVALGALMGIKFHAFQHDPTIQWLGTLGIVALFLFAGLEVDFSELRRGAKVVVQHVVLQTIILGFAAIACAALLQLPEREAILLALALFTPSTGFIFDSLGGFGLDEEQKFWVKSKAVGSEVVALAILFVTVQSTDARNLVLSTSALVALVAVLPWVFTVFSTRILPHAPRSEFTFLVIVAILCAYLTRRLGVYYLVGAFVVGLTAVRMRAALPGLVSEKVLGAVELFASFFVPFYFLKAGLHLSAEDFSARAWMLGAVFLCTAVPVRVAMVVLHRRLVLGEPTRRAAKVGLSLVPTLVFTMVIANILVERFAVDRAIYGALIVFSLGNTLLPGLLLRARLDFERPEDEFPNGSGVGDQANDADAGSEDSLEMEAARFDPLEGTLTALESQEPTPVGKAIREAQDGIYGWIVGRNTSRDALLATRLRHIAPSGGRYWAAVIVSASLGGVGILLDSVPLVVAAAIACPLVSPIAGLALGLASGSPFLVLRTLVRGTGGLVLAVGVAAFVTRLVPYTVAPGLFRPHTPTLLDLAAAAACALVAVLSELRAGSATYVVAARAAVGHVIVVPLCIAGFAMGTGNWPGFGVTMWTLLANVASVVVVSLIAFLAVGLHHIDAARVENRELEGMKDSPVLAALLAPMTRAFASRWAVVPRILMPMTLLLLAAVPLRRALDVVAFDVRARDAVQRAVAALPGRIIETRIDVVGNGVTVAVVQVGDSRNAREARAALERSLRRSIRGSVRVDVMAVPDSAALAVLQDELLATRTLPVDVTEIGREIARAVTSRIETHLRPSRAILNVATRVTVDGYQVLIEWVGPPPSNEDQRDLASFATTSSGHPAHLRVVAYPTTQHQFDPQNPATLALLIARAEQAETTPGLMMCVSRPPVALPVGRRRTRDEDGVASLNAALADHRSVTISDGEQFVYRFAAGSCDSVVPRRPEAVSPLDGGVADPSPH